MRVKSDEAAVIPVLFDGRDCVAVVFTKATENGELDLASVRKALHEPFAAAVEASSLKDLLPLTVDAPTSAELGVRPWALQAVLDNALAVSQQRPR
jgi:hypothetical protein